MQNDSLISISSLSLATSTLQWRGYGAHKEVETDEAFDARWEAYFSKEDIDVWELKKGINELYGHDLVPEPKIVAAMLKAARRCAELVGLCYI